MFPKLNRNLLYNRFSLIILLAILNFHKLESKNLEIPYIQVNKTDGLPSNTVYSIITSSTGYLWAGTNAGLIKFDGNNIRVYNMFHGLISNDVFELFEDNQGRIWLSTFKNKIQFIYNDSLFSHNNCTFLKNLVLKEGIPKYYQDKKGFIWIYCSNQIYLLDEKNRIKQFVLETYDKGGIQAIEYQDSMYFMGYSRLFVYNYGTQSFNASNLKNPRRPATFNLYNGYCYYQDENLNLIRLSDSIFKRRKITVYSYDWKIPLIDSMFWTKTNAGFKLYNKYNFGSYRILLNNILVSGVHKSKSGDIWISTLNKGIIRLSSDKIRNINSDLPVNSVIITDRNLMYTTSNGRVILLDRFKPKYDSTYLIADGKYRSFRTNKLTQDGERIWISSDLGLFTYNFNTRRITNVALKNVALKNVFIENDTLIILDNIEVSFFNKVTKKKLTSTDRRKRFYSYTKYLNQKIVGSQDSLYSFDKELKYYPLNIPFHYRAMDLDVQDSLLVATTAEKGIFIIKGHTVLKNLTTDNGMVSNTCNRSVIYKNYVYTATNHGIHIYSLKNDSLSYLFESDGLPSNNINDIAVDQDTIFAATEEGLSIIPLSALKYRPPFPCFAQPVITYQDTLWNKPDSVSTRTDKLVLVKVNALSYTSKIPLRFFYRIKEIDSNFKETREQNLELRFPHPGYFTLEVHALNGDFQKSQVLRMHVFVQPYFYQTTWFKLLIVLLVVLILLGTYQILLKAARRRAQIKHETENKMRNLELSAWRSTVNPHFLFNALNTMQGLFHNNDFEAVNQFIIEFSSVLRKTIDQSGRIMISIQEEVNYLKNYLEFEKVKRHGILDFDIQWDDDKILKWYIPSMLIQPVLENSLKHGIRQNGLGELHVSFFLLDDKIRCVLHDNGDGFKEDDLNGENSKGLRLITDKIAIVEKLLKKNIHFSFQNRKNTRGEIIGTETIFLFPIITNIRQFPDIESQFKDPDPKV